MSTKIQFKENYKSLDKTIFWIIEQAKAGAPYMKQFPKFKNPCKIFSYFKKITTFHSDPPGIELIQHPHTLFEENYHGISGAGDCDCFSTLLLSYCIANKLPCDIILYGNSRKYAKHIAIDIMGVTIDLTSPSCNFERPYKYSQKIPVIV